MERGKSETEMDDKGEKAKVVTDFAERTWHKGPMGSSEAGKKPMRIKEKDGDPQRFGGECNRLAGPGEGT